MNTLSIRKPVFEDASAIARVHIDSWRSTYPGIVPDSYLAGMSCSTSATRWEKRLSRNAEEYAMFIAEDENGRIVGFADGGRERLGDPDFDAELYAIYLLHPYQQQGLGALLVHRLVNHLREHHFQSLLVWVFEQNPSRRFYEKLGALPVRQGAIELDGQPVQEVGLGWPDLERLDEHLRARMGRQGGTTAFGYRG